MQRPRLFLAFANARNQYLNTLNKERKAIEAIPPMGEGTEAMFQAFTYLEAKDYSAFETSLRKVRPQWREELNLFRLAREGKKERTSRELGRIMSDKGNLNFIWLIQTNPFGVFNDLRSSPSAARVMANYGITFRPHPYLGPS